MSAGTEALRADFERRFLVHTRRVPPHACPLPTEAEAREMRLPFGLLVRCKECGDAHLLILNPEQTWVRKG